MAMSMLKPVLRNILRPFVRLVRPIRPRNDLAAYWANPDDGMNAPENYLRSGSPTKRSEYLIALVRKHSIPDPAMLEIGCNAGRNLNALWQAGFHQLTAIEISSPAVMLFRETFPDLAQHVRIHNCAVENCIRSFDDSHFDAVFAMAVLQHIHPDSDWVFREIARITKGVLLTIEDEQSVSPRHIPRRYDRIFEQLGMRQVFHERNSEEHGFYNAFVTRVFCRT